MCVWGFIKCLKSSGQQLSTTHHLMKCDFTHSEKHQLREIFSSVSYNIFNIQSLQVKPVSFYIFILFVYVVLYVVHSCFFLSCFALCEFCNKVEVTHQNTRWHCSIRLCVWERFNEFNLVLLPQIDSFELLYYYDEHLGHLMWYVYNNYVACTEMDRYEPQFPLFWVGRGVIMDVFWKNIQRQVK